MKAVFLVLFISLVSINCLGADDALDSLMKKYSNTISHADPPKPLQKEVIADTNKEPASIIKETRKHSGAKRMSEKSVLKKLKKRSTQSVDVLQKKVETGEIDPTPKPVERSPSQSLPETPVASIVSVQSADEKKDEVENTGLFGNWLGAKNSLKEKGLEFNIGYKGDSVTTIRGIDENKSVFLGNVDITLDIDFEKILGLKGLSLFIYGLGNHGDHPSEFIGDSFVTSNIEAPNTFKAYEFYLKQAIDENFSILFGLRDLNADFYSTQSTKPFVNSAFGISPSLAQTGVNGPSIFPVTAPAISFNYYSPTSFYFHSAAFNAQAGNPDDYRGTFVARSLENGLLNITEVGFSGERESGIYKYGLGAWNYSKKIDTLDSELGQAENTGLYILLDHGFSNQFSAFLKYGTASQSVNQFSSAIEVGMNFKGLLNSRPDDHLIIGFAQANTGNDYSRINNTLTSESVLEIAYSIDVTSGITVTPDFQYVKNPGLVIDSKPVEVGSIRLEIQF